MYKSWSQVKYSVLEELSGLGQHLWWEWIGDVLGWDPSSDPVSEEN